MRLEISEELYRTLKEKGYHEDLCTQIARYMNTEFTARRMLGYLKRTGKPKEEVLVDEMLAILSDRDSIMRKKEMEQAQAVMNDVYRNGL